MRYLLLRSHIPHGGRFVERGGEQQATLLVEPGRDNFRRMIRKQMYLLARFRVKHAGRIVHAARCYQLTLVGIELCAHNFGRMTPECVDTVARDGVPYLGSFVK